MARATGAVGRPGPHPPALLGQLVRFAAVGVLGTAGYLAVFLVLRRGVDAQRASLVARVLLAAVTTQVNGRVTFHSRRCGWRLHLVALLLLVVGGLVTSGALLVEHHALGSPDRTTEIVVVVLANLLAAVVRFLLLRRWLVGRPRPDRTGRARRAQPERQPGAPDAGRPVGRSTGR